MPRSRRTLGLATLAAFSVFAAGCGGDDDKEASTADEKPSTSGTSGAPVDGAKKGGTLSVVSAGEFTEIDCGQAYYQYDYMLCQATVRPLVSFKPDDPQNPQPDLAEALPEVAPDGKTITVKIKQGIKFSPPVDREVASKDVKYGIERLFFASVANGYAGAYYGDIVGAKTGVKSGTKIPGISTPDDQTIVFKLSKPSGSLLGALALPGSAPVPEEWAKKFDAKSPSTYPVNQVATGPYMIEQDSKGKAVGYKAGQTTTVVRNPNWDPKTDRRPAPLDGFTFKSGNDPAVAVKQIYQGKGQVSGDFAPLPADIKLGLERYKSQLSLHPNGGFRFVAMNTRTKPFDDVDVRRAVLAIFDRKAMQLARGGVAIGDVATHLIPPGIPGHEEAGGLKAPSGLDYLANERGDMNVAAKYMKAAGYASGKYDGGKEFTMIGVNAGVAKKAAQVAQAQFEKLGFEINLRLVTPDTMYSKFCQIPKSGYDICPNPSWGKDFLDAQSILDPTFNGANILQEGNNNFPLFDDKAINAEIEKAKGVVGKSARAKAWGQVDIDLMKQAAVVPWLFDRQGNVSSKDVNAVLNQDNTTWDMSYTGFKK